jgi:hypothetical protein
MQSFILGGRKSWNLAYKKHQVSGAFKQKLKPYPFYGRSLLPGNFQMSVPIHKSDYAYDKPEKTSGILQNPIRRFQLKG